MKYPGHVTIRKADPDDSGALELSSGQTEARLSRQLQNDKQRAIVNRNREIKRITGMLNRTQDHNLKKELKQKISKLENENKETQRFI